MAQRQEATWRSILNDLIGHHHLDITYADGAMGPLHNQQWTGSYTWNNTAHGSVIIGTATATSRKHAKELAAEAAVRYLRGRNYTLD